MRSSHICFLLFIGSIFLTVYYTIVPYVREFNFDGTVMLRRLIKSPTAWGRLLGTILGVLIMWRRYWSGLIISTRGVWLLGAVS